MFRLLHAGALLYAARVTARTMLMIRRIQMIVGIMLATASVALGALDWQAGPWGVVVDSNGSPGSAYCPVDYPGGTKTGNAVAVYYQLQPTNVPQLWVFLTDGFWRQTSATSPFLTSYRLFRYFSSGNEDRFKHFCGRCPG